jgi:hypothetical protein
MFRGAAVLIRKYLKDVQRSCSSDQKIFKGCSEELQF